jgi:hypothetical protein
MKNVIAGRTIRQKSSLRVKRLIKSYKFTFAAAIFRSPNLLMHNTTQLKKRKTSEKEKCGVIKDKSIHYLSLLAQLPTAWRASLLRRHGRGPGAALHVRRLGLGVRRSTSVGAVRRGGTVRAGAIGRAQATTVRHRTAVIGPPVRCRGSCGLLDF